MTNRIGQQLGNYRLVQLLGQGGFADVYLGEHIHLRTQAAIKVLQTQLTQKDLGDFLIEAQRIARLNHRNIVHTLDFGIDTAENVPYLVMDYATHGTLRQLHPDGSIVPLITVVSYVKQIAAALQHTHNHRLVHRDVKPQNMLMGSNDEVLLSDFGIAVLAHSTSSMTPQNTSGTIHYMAPEHIRGQARPASDQYSLGIVVYEWLSGTRPFKGSHFVDIAMRHLNDAPPLLRDKMPNISPAVEQVVMRTLEKDPEKRYTSVEKFAQELDRAYQAEHRVVSPPAVKRLPLGTLLHTYQVLQEGAYAFSWTLNRLRIASGDTGGRIEVYDIVTGNVVSLNRAHNTKVETIVWSPDGNKIASFAPGDEMIQVWNTSNGSHITTCTDVMLSAASGSRRGGSQFIVWSPNSTLIAFPRSHTDPTIHIWDTHSKKCIQTFNGHLVAIKADPWISTSTGVSALAWSPNNAHIASLGFDVTGIGNAGKAIEVWTIQVQETSTGNCITKCVFRDPPPLSGGGQMSGWGVRRAEITWSPDGVYIASHADYKWAGRAYLDRDQNFYPRQVQIWNALVGDEVITLPNLAELAWSPSSARVAFANHAETVDIWDVVSGKVIATYNKHAAVVTWSPDNKYIASADGNGTIYIWNANSAKTVLAIDNGSKAVAALIWSPDGTQLVTISQDKMVRVWQVV